MKINHIYDHLRNDVQPALNSKLEEFSMLGYGQVAEQELWDFLIKKKWKKLNESKRISEIVDDILSVKVGEFFSFASIEALKETEFVLDEEGLRELLK